MSEVIFMEKVCNVSDLSQSPIKGFPVKDKYVIISKIKGKFYAVDAVCPHMNGFLPVGKLEEDHIISCPTHGAKFDLKTGKLLKDVDEEIKEATKSGANDLESYKVHIKDESIFIDI
jgi:3-phenylpropionate/trans-cinnamate dioxygenase ferredoxin subunit